MKKHTAGLLFCLASLFWTCPLAPGSAMAAETPKEIVIASEAWEDCTNQDGTGLYWDIFRAVYESSGIQVKPQIRSYDGAAKLLGEKKVDAMVGAYKDEVEGGLYPKWHFGADRVAVTFKEGTAWAGEASLSGKKVGWIKGYSYDDYLKVKVEKYEFDQRADAFKVLDRGRIDFFMDDAADLQTAKESGLIPAAGYRFEQVLQLNLYIVFAGTENGKISQEIFDREFEKLLKAGKIKALYEKWASSGSQYPFQ